MQLEPERGKRWRSQRTQERRSDCSVLNAVPREKKPTKKEEAKGEKKVVMCLSGFVASPSSSPSFFVPPSPLQQVPGGGCRRKVQQVPLAIRAFQFSGPLTSLLQTTQVPQHLVSVVDVLRDTLSKAPRQCAILPQPRPAPLIRSLWRS